MALPDCGYLGHDSAFLVLPSLCGNSWRGLAPVLQPAFPDQRLRVLRRGRVRLGSDALALRLLRGAAASHEEFVGLRALHITGWRVFGVAAVSVLS